MVFRTNGEYVPNQMLDKAQHIIFYGASSRNIEAIQTLNIAEKVCFYVDSNAERIGDTVDGYLVKDPSVLKDNPDCVILSVLVEYAQDVTEVVEKQGVNTLYFYMQECFSCSEMRQCNDLTSLGGNPYKYVHIFQTPMFVFCYYEMLEEEFNINEHLVILNYTMKTDDYHILDFIKKKNRVHKNILFFDNVHLFWGQVPDQMNCNQIFETDEFFRILDCAEKIFLHSAFIWDKAEILIKEMAVRYAEKMAWICMGGDSTSCSETVIKDILQKIRWKYATKSRIETIQRNFQVTCCDAGVTYSYIPKTLSEEGFEKKDCPNTTKILLGHSSMPYGNHSYGMELLQQYKEEPIEIYCPLSYGDKAYQKTVIEQGKQMFGEKFIPLTEVIPPVNYYAFLKTIDVLLLPMTEMHGGTTLMYMNSLGKKIYMFPDMIENFSDSGIRAENVEMIRGKSLKEFRASTNEPAEDLKQKTVLAWKELIYD